MRSLRAGDRRLTLVGVHDDRFVLRKSDADRHWLIPPGDHPRVARAIADVIRRERIDLILPTDDDDVALVSRIRRRLPCRVFLPPPPVLRRCHDKFAMAAALRRAGVPVAAGRAVTSIAALAKTVVAPDVVGVATDAVRAIARRPAGAFSIDLKADESGRPCVTEINGGRFISGTNLFDLTGRHNMALTYVRLALGHAVDVEEVYDRSEDDYMVRDLDTLPAIFRAEALFRGIREARW